MSHFSISRRSFLSSSAALGLATVTSASLLPRGASAETPKRGGHLKLGLNGGSTTDSLDTATYQSGLDLTLAKSWGDCLIVPDPASGEPLPGIAEEWSSSPDLMEWTFRIRKDVRFHNGNEMTVADCAQTIRRHTDANSKSGALGLLGGIDRIEERGDDLFIGLKEADADLPLVLSDYHLVIQPNGGFDDPSAAIGTGPYKLTSYEPGQRVTLERNTDDWNPDRGFVDSVEILVINDNTARFAALAAGQVHLVNMVDPKVIDLLTSSPDVQLLRSRGKGYYSFLAHCDTAPFDNNDLRMALKLAVNRQEILDKILAGYGTIGNDYPVNSAYALAPEDIEQRQYDPEQAAFYFKKSGHEGPIVLRAADAAFPGAIDAALLYQMHAAEAGIEITVQREPDDGYWSGVWNVKPFCASYWGARPTQNSRYMTNFVSNAEWNDTRFKNPEFDALIAKARGELDVDKRKALYRDAALMVRDTGGLILPVFNDYLNAASSKVKGYVEDIGNDLSNGYLLSRVWLDT